MICTRDKALFHETTFSNYSQNIIIISRLLFVYLTIICDCSILNKVSITDLFDDNLLSKSKWQTNEAKKLGLGWRVISIYTNQGNYKLQT